MEGSSCYLHCRRLMAKSLNPGANQSSACVVVGQLNLIFMFNSNND
jgi:hypothetical protein